MIDKCYFPVSFVYKYPWLIAISVSTLLILIHVTFRLYELTLKTIKKYFVTVWLQTRQDDVSAGISIKLSASVWLGCSRVVVEVVWS